MRETAARNGWVDLQVNGFMGVDFSSPNLTEDDFVRACRLIRRRGTAVFLPTIITSPLRVYERNLPLMARVMKRGEFRTLVPGFHVEGPFISGEPGAVGAHNPDWVCKPDLKFMARLMEAADGLVRLITLAPEAPDAVSLIRWVSRRGVVVSLGHSLAGEEEIARAVKAGARLVTHLGNGLPQLIHRHQNFIWAALANDDLSVMIIADGHHLPAAVIKTILRVKGPERVIVTSDSSPVAGLPPGRYRVLGNSAVLEKSGRLYNPQKKCLVGSSATMARCMKFLRSLNLLDSRGLAMVGRTNALKCLAGSVSQACGEQSHLPIVEHGGSIILPETVRQQEARGSTGVGWG